MKVFHYINFGLIFLFLIGICILEEVYVSNSLTKVQNDCFQIEKELERNEDVLLSMNMTLLVDNLEYHWDKNESDLCYMVNHKSIQEIGQEIAKMKSYIANDDIDAFKVSIEAIKYYCHSYLHFMGANLHNIL
ncbi:MAG: DUF4363 family protein [Acetobacter sp.]|nr:DUF4363 family protein [Acetobacter sp.]